MSRLMIGEWQVMILDVPGLFPRKVYLYKPDPLRGGTEFMGENGMLHFREETDLGDPPHFALMTTDQLEAFSLALSERGIRPKSESVIEGKLIATERHLEDMRLIALSKYKENK